MQPHEFNELEFNVHMGIHTMELDFSSILGGTEDDRRCSPEPPSEHCSVLLLILAFMHIIVVLDIYEEEEGKLYFNNLLHIHQHTFSKYMISLAVVPFAKFMTNIGLEFSKWNCIHRKAS